MQSELFARKRTVARSDLRSRRRNKTPTEIIHDNIVEITNSFIDDFLLGDRRVLVSNNIFLDFKIINELIEEKLSEKQIKNLNPTALIGGFIILGRNNNIDANKVEFIFKKKVNDIPVIQFFYNQKVREEDIIRYARLWKYLLQT